MHYELSILNRLMEELHLKNFQYKIGYHFDLKKHLKLDHSMGFGHLELKSYKLLKNLSNFFKCIVYLAAYFLPDC